MNTGTLIVIQTNIPIDAPPVCQIKIIPFIQVERTINKNRIFREELHANPSSSECRIGSQIHSLFLPCIEVLEEQLRLSITYITVQIHFKGFLVRLGRTDDFGQEIQSVIPMLQVNTNSIDQQTIGTHMIKIGFTVYPFLRRSIEVETQLIERNALHHA